LFFSIRLTITDYYMTVPNCSTCVYFTFEVYSGFRVYGVQPYFQQYFSNTMAVSFIGGGNQSTQRKPPTFHMSLTNLMLHRVHFVRAEFKLTTLLVIGTDFIGSCKSNYHMITTTTAPGLFWNISILSIITLKTILVIDEFIIFQCT
jgi:hypothetical protein